MRLRTFAITLAMGAGLATAAFAQAPRSPSDPASPGAVVTPQDRSTGDMQKRRDGGNTSGSSSGRSTTAPDTNNPASPQPPRSDGGKPATGGGYR
jgi:hypothetical protein